MADLSSVGMALDHIACISGPSYFSQRGILFIIAVWRAFCPLNGESDIVVLGSSRAVFPNPEAEGPTVHRLATFLVLGGTSRTLW
jgi:hypothetical protein